jgi:hypothetical protein
VVTESVEAAVQHEFGCYYLAYELLAVIGARVGSLALFEVL